MNDDDAGPSRSSQPDDFPNNDESPHAVEADAVETEKIAKERMIRAKKQRLEMLDKLLKELDTTMFFQFITIYYLEYVLRFSFATHLHYIS